MEFQFNANLESFGNELALHAQWQQKLTQETSVSARTTTWPPDQSHCLASLSPPKSQKLNDKKTEIVFLLENGAKTPMKHYLIDFKMVLQLVPYLIYNCVK